MKVIPRLEQLRKEAEEIDRDLGELQAKKAELEEALSQAQEATDKNLIERFRAGEPARLGDLEAKSKDLESELAVVRATFEAMAKHRAVLEPELADLEQAQKLAAAWKAVSLPFIAARVLSAQQRERFRQAVQSAPERKIRTTWGEPRVEKRVPAHVGRSQDFVIGQLEYASLRAAHLIDPGRFPRAESVDLSMVDEGWGRDARASRRHDRRVLEDIWAEFLNVQARFLEEYGIDIGPDEQEINETIKQAIPSPQKPPYH